MASKRVGNAKALSLVPRKPHAAFRGVSMMGGGTKRSTCGGDAASVAGPQPTLDIMSFTRTETPAAIILDV
jgi:hypothetical protein